MITLRQMLLEISRAAVAVRWEHCLRENRKVGTNPPALKFQQHMMNVRDPMRCVDVLGNSVRLDEVVLSVVEACKWDGSRLLVVRVPRQVLWVSPGGTRWLKTTVKVRAEY